MERASGRYREVDSPFRIPKYWSIFVNNVSKRIHSSRLKDAFQSYGEVIDVFIAYRSKKRLSAGSTFAFVRFRNKFGANTAVRRADGRRPSLRDSRSYREDLGGVQGDVGGMQGVEDKSKENGSN
ncbi:uncharacterized protein LOC120118301 [Hibiscus syriacus]|uniref:uncharacterized protein LOC120118301 n=1 Tax=Hibiscus syriacus TaxID=106335 RepID=UPI0019210136|nr:uncharacterized protein LOC120118301 [Hibiscus syriacus]